MANAMAAKVTAARIGVSGGSDIALSTGERVALADLKETNESWMPKYMGMA